MLEASATVPGSFLRLEHLPDLELKGILLGEWVLASAFVRLAGGSGLVVKVPS
jgi:hypothetical protein